MTNMQLQYSQLFEQKQHNRAMEQQGAADLAETHRANLASEDLRARQIEADIAKANAINAANERIAQLQADTNLQLQEMRNFMSEKQLEQTKRQIDTQIEKASAEIGNLEANTNLTAAKTKDQVQKTQSALGQKLAKIVGNSIDKTTLYASNWLAEPANKQTLKTALTTPLYREFIAGWNVYQQKKQAAKRGAGHNRATTTTADPELSGASK